MLPEAVLQYEALKQFALWRTARNNKMTVTDDELRAVIQGFLGTQDLTANIDGYRRWTKSVLGENPRDFEEAMRRALLSQKYAQVLLSEVELTPLPDAKKASQERREKIQQENQRRQDEALQQFFLSANIKKY